jgi:glycosyltransferase involved in cell wall biosynthesis
LQRRAAEVLGDRVRFTGSVTAVAPLYDAADVLVLASRGGDSMPATLIEAGLCGLPAVATPVGAIAEVVDDGVTGLLVPVDDHDRLVAALRSLVTDPARRAVLGGQARDRCRDRFSIDVVAGAWEQALVRAVDRSRPPRGTRRWDPGSSDR